ncbi:BQ5605_C008g04960 [Microbotryum silenes-dioicae]|uniref:BQ5605_C008g04960 protein n=1 Tax=Microbotryum silenes-dioicae TaxID=796604 RepID=A0A2X0MFW7_9BASI|nr:BQ5605_C008g04960 [Microbotryum silenes-dioicae]
MVRSFALVKIYGMAREGRSLVSGQYPRVKARLVLLYWIAFRSAPTAQQPALEIQPREDIRRCRGDKFASLQSVPDLRDAAGRTSTSRRCHGGYKKLNKEGLFDAWSHARHQPKRRAPQATFDWPPRARKRSERIFEDY